MRENRAEVERLSLIHLPPISTQQPTIGSLTRDLSAQRSVLRLCYLGPSLCEGPAFSQTRDKSLLATNISEIAQTAKMGAGSAILLVIVTILCEEPLPPLSLRKPQSANRECLPGPPIGVYAIAGCGADLLINICLTILGCVAFPDASSHTHTHTLSLSLSPLVTDTVSLSGQLLPRPHPRVLSRVRVPRPPRAGTRGPLHRLPRAGHLQRAHPERRPRLRHHGPADELSAAPPPGDQASSAARSYLAACRCAPRACPPVGGEVMMVRSGTGLPLKCL